MFEKRICMESMRLERYIYQQEERQPLTGLFATSRDLEFRSAGLHGRAPASFDTGRIVEARRCAIKSLPSLRSGTQVLRRAGRAIQDHALPMQPVPQQRSVATGRGVVPCTVCLHQISVTSG